MLTPAKQTFTATKGISIAEFARSVSEASAITAFKPVDPTVTP